MSIDAARPLLINEIVIIDNFVHDLSDLRTLRGNYDVFRCWSDYVSDKQISLVAITDII